MLRKISRMELLEVITVGLPFCCFKVLSGLTLLRLEPGLSARALGALLVALGVLDLLINTVNLVGLVAFRHRLLDACFFSVVSRRHGRLTAHPESLWRDFGNSTDVLVSFMIVAAMVGSGVLGSVPRAELALWNSCVVLNVLGAGLSRFGSSLRNFDLSEK